jgi:alanyl-tRNA synthetase
VTHRLYYLDPALREFEATVAAVDRRDDGRIVVRLDRSAFYPTSGGQPFDTGTLSASGPRSTGISATVIDVFDETDGPDSDVLHVVDGEALQPGQVVQGRIDWARRFDHMQQHTGQHVLSAAFDTLFKARTVSFHMGAEVSTIDLDKAITEAQIAAAEREANRIVWEDRSVAISFVSSEEAAQLPLRKPPKKSGTLRLIGVEAFDLSACGGTHVARTGEIGIIAVGGWERFKGGLRVEFLCGARALARFRTLRDTMGAAVRSLSVSVTDLPHGIERLQEESKAQRRQIVALQSDLAKYRGRELAGQAEETASGRLVAMAVEADAAGLKALAAAVTEHAGTAAVLVSPTRPALIVVARAADLGIRANDVLAALIARFGGKGGGKPDLAQGGGLNASSDEILSAARLHFANVNS